MESLLLRPLSVLLVDDDEDLLHLLQYKLRGDGFRVSISHNGEDLWEKIQSKVPDIILLDIHMEGTDGGQICELLKKNPVTAAIPVFMFSSNDNIQQITEECGANGFIPKSISTDQLKQRLLRLMAA